MARLTATARQVIRVLERQGWKLDHTRGSHYHYRHPAKPGMVSVPCHKATSLKPKTLSSILDGAGFLGRNFSNCGNAEPNHGNRLAYRRIEQMEDA
jgi:predicted RNA binding protein YcfA (HicA-like mRNA interferase family)